MHSDPHSMSSHSTLISATYHSMSVNSYSHSIKLHSPSTYSKTPLTLKGSIHFKWYVSERYTSLETHSSELRNINMADRWLRRLELVDNIPRNIRNGRRRYHFDYENYDEEQFRSRFRMGFVDSWRCSDTIYLHIMSEEDLLQPI